MAHCIICGCALGEGECEERGNGPCLPMSGWMEALNRYRREIRRIKHCGHKCELGDKYCMIGADPNQHDHNLPWDDPEQHWDHKGGCVCPYGDMSLL